MCINISNDKQQLKVKTTEHWRILYIYIYIYNLFSSSFFLYSPHGLCQSGNCLFLLLVVVVVRFHWLTPTLWQFLLHAPDRLKLSRLDPMSSLRQVFFSFRIVNSIHLQHFEGWYFLVNARLSGVSVIPRTLACTTWIFTVRMRSFACVRTRRKERLCVCVCERERERERERWT